MRSGISITLSRRDRHQLEAIASDRNTPHKHVWRARIVPRSATASAHARSSLRQAPRRPRSGAGRSGSPKRASMVSCASAPAHPGGLRSRGERTAVVRLTLEPPPHEATHWTARAMAREDRRACGLDGAEDLEGARPSPTANAPSLTSQPLLHLRSGRVDLAPNACSASAEPPEDPPPPRTARWVKDRRCSTPAGVR